MWFIEVFPSIECLITGLFFPWLTLVGLHVEVAAGGGGGRGGGGRAITRALNHAALGGGRRMAVAGGRGRATVTAGWQAEGCRGEGRLRLTQLLLHGGMAGA